MRLLIDTDPGIDDALAIAMALGSPEVSIEAITTVAGNVPVELATRNLLRLLSLAAPARVPPVGRGAAAPIRGPLVTAAHVHGDDGLGNVEDLLDRDGRPRYPLSSSLALEMRDGADLILETADRVGRDLTVVALGPLTNLAVALERDRRVLSRTGRIVVMGGAVAVPGNTTPAAEFNFHVDPEAAATVLEAGLPIELVPLDVTRRVVVREADVARAVGDDPPPLGRLVADIARHGFASGSDGVDAGIVLHDPLAVGVAIDASLAGFEAMSVAVECEGRLTRGMSVADRRPRRGGGPAPNCRVAMSIDAPRFLRMFLERLCPASR
jgi:purine nucleosidase/pyrimidine-specific ribonucleoside hydrolase